MGLISFIVITFGYYYIPILCQLVPRSQYLSCYKYNQLWPTGNYIIFTVTKILDWSSTGYLTAAIESSIHLWSSRTQSVRCTINVKHFDAGETTRPSPTDDSTKTMVVSLKWDARGEKLAYSYTVERTQPPLNRSSSAMSTSTSTYTTASMPRVVDVLDRDDRFADITAIRMQSFSSDDDTAPTNSVKFSNYIKVGYYNQLYSILSFQARFRFN